MADIAIIEDEYLNPAGIPPERMAWAILLLAFAAFCVICVLTMLIANFFFFQSSLPLDVALNVGRGTVRVTESSGTQLAETQRRTLSRETIIRTDSQDTWSQAVLAFSASELEESLIATVVLKNDTSLLLRRANRPRFGWSTTIYEIQLRDLDGEIDIQISDKLPRPIEFAITTVTGDEVLINRGGRYLIDASDTQLIVTTREGEAIVISSDRSLAYAIPADQQAVFDTRTQTLTRMPYLQNLLTNNQLNISQIPQQDLAVDSSLSLPPFGWSCTNGPTTNLPLGNYFEDRSPDGRLSFRMARGNNADTNAYTRCIQTFGSGIDLSVYDYLSLQTVFYIESQSLNGCGQEGSECPIMLRINYQLAPDGDILEWIHGVYTIPLSQLQEQEGWKRQCGTCLQSHIRIRPGTWYIYESGNLFDVIPDERRPTIITQVEFFAEGHQYNVYIDEISLLARPRANGNE